MTRDSSFLIFTFFALMHFNFSLGAEATDPNSSAQRKEQGTSLRKDFENLSAAQRAEIVRGLNAEVDALHQAIEAGGNARTLGLVVEPGNRMASSAKTLQERANLYARAATIVKEGFAGHSDEELGQINEAVVLITRLSYIWCGNKIINPNRNVFWAEDLAKFSNQFPSIPLTAGALQFASPYSMQTNDAQTWKWYPFNSMATAFMVGKNSALTNYHAVQSFIELRNSKWVVKESARIRVNFSIEYDRCPTSEAVIGDVTAVYVDQANDLAILTLAGSNLPTPTDVVNFSIPQEGAYVMVIGFPQADPNVSRRDQDQVFMGPDGLAPFKIRRVAPGMVVRGPDPIPNNVLRHDASTLGGNSGSPIVNLLDGKFMGVHKAGLAYQYNEGVTAKVVLDFLRKEGVVPP